MFILSQGFFSFFFSWFLPKHPVLSYAIPKRSSFASCNVYHIHAGSNPFSLQGTPENLSIDAVGGCSPAHGAEALLAQLRWGDGGGRSSFPLGDWASPAHLCLSLLLHPCAQVCVLVCMEMSFLWADGSNVVGLELLGSGYNSGSSACRCSSVLFCVCDELFCHIT